MNDSIDIRGFVTVDFYDIEGNYLRSIREHNLVTTAGKDYIMKKVLTDYSVAGTAITKIALGEGSTPPDVTDIALENEKERMFIDQIFNTNNVGTFSTLARAGTASGPTQEAGLYTNEFTPTLVSRIVFSSSFNKDPAEAIQINWELKIGSDS